MARKIYRKRLIAVIGSLCVVASLPHKSVNAGAAAGGSTEITQLVNMGVLVLDKIKQAQQLIEQIDQTRMKVRNLEKSILAPVYQAKQVIDGVRDTVREGQAIAYSVANLDQVIKDRYKNFDEFLDVNYTEFEFQDDVRDWAQTTQDSISNALRGAGIQMDNIDDEEVIMEAFYTKIQTEDGRQKAIELTNEINAFNGKQLQSLRSLIATQMQITGAYYEQQNAIDTAIRAKEAEYWNPTLHAGMADTIYGNEATWPNVPVYPVP